MAKVRELKAKNITAPGSAKMHGCSRAAVYRCLSEQLSPQRANARKSPPSHESEGLSHTEGHIHIRASAQFAAAS